MHGTKLVAMWEDSGVKLNQEQIIQQYLQAHLKLFCNLEETQDTSRWPHSCYASFTKHAYEEDKKEEISEFSYKDTPLAVATQIARRLQGKYQH